MNDITEAWKNLLISDNLKKEIKNYIKNFSKSKQYFQTNKLPYKQGLIFSGDCEILKSEIIDNIAIQTGMGLFTIFHGAGILDIETAFTEAQEKPSIIYIEGLDSRLGFEFSEELFCNIIDRVNSTEGLLLIASIKTLENLPKYLTENLSRFDKHFFVENPNQKLINKFLINSLNIKDDQLTEKLQSHNVSYSDLRQICASSYMLAKSKNRKPCKKDLQNSINNLIAHKSTDSKISLDKYFL